MAVVSGLYLLEHNRSRASSCPPGGVWLTSNLEESHHHRGIGGAAPFDGYWRNHRCFGVTMKINNEALRRSSEPRSGWRKQSWRQLCSAKNGQNIEFLPIPCMPVPGATGFRDVPGIELQVMLR